MSDRRRDDSRQAWAAEAEAAPVVRGVLRVVPPEAPYAPANGAAETHLFLMGWVYPLVDPVVSLGRGLENNAVLLDPSVSREHAVAREDPDGWYITNRSQRRPLWVGERLLAPGEEVPLAPGAALLLGATRLQFLVPRDADIWGMVSDGLADGPPAVEPARALAPGVTLQFALGGRGGRAAWWLTGAAGLVLLGVCGILTLATLLVMERQAVASGRPAWCRAGGAGGSCSGGWAPRPSARCWGPGWAAGAGSTRGAGCGGRGWPVSPRPWRCMRSSIWGCWWGARSPWGARRPPARRRWWCCWADMCRSSAGRLYCCGCCWPRCGAKQR